ncbi:caspase family protein [Paraburkholderia sp. MM5477-R1]|uniref:caspase family protein n=1 Tax=Paraburkholderia sp. MM5477-R1 TaxID=2991062 RepID=UPI003D213CD8
MATRIVGLVAVGVDKVGLLEKLDGAASGAAKLAGWLRGQSTFGVTAKIKELTDASGCRVSARDVQDAVRCLIETGDLDLLILYFAGHGIVKSGGDEQVLLTDVEHYKDEAIAIAPTVANAWHSTVPHLVVICDSCRNAVDPFGPLGTVAGKPALDRRAVVGARKSKVDVFYATEPSQTAKEFRGEGFFTNVLLDALNRPPEDVCEEWPWLVPGQPVITAWSLEDYLGAEVPLRAAQQTPPFSQTPDGFVTSRVPQFIGYVVPEPSSLGTWWTPDLDRVADRFRMGDRPKPRPIPIDREVATRAARERNLAIDEVAAMVTVNFPVPNAAIGAGLAAYLENYIGSEYGRAAFETRTGYSVLGGAVEKVLLSGGSAGELANAEGEPSVDVRLYPPPYSSPPREQRGSVALFFKGGTVCILPILPGYVGTLHLIDGRVASVSFEVSEQLRQDLGDTYADRQFLSERRALAAALSFSGKLQRLAQNEGRLLADYIRQSKRADPALGIYAAYAYALSGNDDGSRSVFDWMKGYGSLDLHNMLPPAPVPFDVAMLAGVLSRETALGSPGFAPFLPMMTLGWSLMESYVNADSLHPTIIVAGKHRLNAEWTTFRYRDVHPMLDAFERGELK